jgi:hypothetical protein
MNGIIATAAAAILLLAGTSAATAATGVGHDRFTSDPYADNWCGIDGTSVDQGVVNYTLDGSRTSLHVVTTFTATASGKSMEIVDSGLQTQSSPVDNGNGTYSVTFVTAGTSPLILLPTGKPVVDTGFLEAVATFDTTTGDFVGFEIVKQAGSRPAGCAQIIAATS